MYGPVVARVVLYTSSGCHLCERARAVLDELRAEVPFELEEVDIRGDAELEARYRESLPGVEIDGRHAFSYFVPREAFRRKVATQSPRCEGRL